MSEEEFDSLRACLTDRCYCAEFVKGGLGGCPEIRLQCWEHADHTTDCPACTLCDYLDSMDIKLWKWHLSRIECNLKKCAHDRVAHTCLSCECICGKCVKDFWVGCVCKDCVTEYQQPQEDDDDLPLTPPTSPSSPSRGVKRSHEETNTDQEREEPVFKKLEIPYPDELLDDAIINMKIIRPDDYTYTRVMKISALPRILTLRMRIQSHVCWPVWRYGTSGDPSTWKAIDRPLVWYLVIGTSRTWV